MIMVHVCQLYYDMNAMNKESNVLDFKTLQVTKNQLHKVGFFRLESAIQHILKYNKILKPSLDKLNQSNLHYYEIDLSVDDITDIVDMLADLEVSSLDINYNTTRAATYYAELLDKWNNLPNYR